MGFLKNKKALIVGLASSRSIAYGVAQAFHEQGAELAFTYQNDRLKDRVVKMAAEFGSELTYPCDVGSDQEIDAVIQGLTKSWETIDIIIHAVGFAPANELDGDYIDCVTREGFKIAHDISSYSFAALAKAASQYLPESAALLTLSYLGAERAFPNYNVMGLAKASLEANVRYMANSLGPRKIRVNGISAGPIRTLAASGIKDFRKMLNFNASISPLRENITLEQVGNAAAFLCSDLASGITGEIIHVDAGFHCVGLGDLNNA